MSYKRVRTKKVYEQVADSLIELIKTGVLKPGDKVKVEMTPYDLTKGRITFRLK